MEDKLKENKLLYIGQKAIIDKDGEVLIVEDPVIGLDFPGGKLKVEEIDLKESLRREVKEETGLDIEIGDAFYSWIVKFPPHPVYKINDVYLVAFKCEYVSGEVRLSEEHKSYKWVNRDNYRENGYHEIDDFTPHLRALEKYFEGSC